MKAGCAAQKLQFEAHGKRDVVADFDGGRMTSDGGGLLLREANCCLGDLMARLGQCVSDFRQQGSVEHTATDLIAQRVFALALGYEDLNDHGTLRRDSLLALLAGHPETAAQHRYHRMLVDRDGLDNLLVDLFLESQAEAPEEIWLDRDATDDPTHGQQEGRFYHGYYREHCYLPLYIFCEHHALCARLRTADRDASDGSVEELERIMGRIRERWPATRIRIRADAGFCRDGILSWCEANAVGYVLGLARNPVLTRRLRHAMRRARRCCWQTGKAEHCPLCLFDLRQGANPRFVVTNLELSEIQSPQRLYEQVYCARGEMENRIKEQQVGLAGTAMAKAQCSTIRLKLFKIAAVIRITTRKVWLSLSPVHPFQHLYATALRNLRAPPHASPHPLPSPVPAGPEQAASPRMPCTPRIPCIRAVSGPSCRTPVANSRRFASWLRLVRYAG